MKLQTKLVGEHINWQDARIVCIDLDRMSWQNRQSKYHKLFLEKNPVVGELGLPYDY